MLSLFYDLGTALINGLLIPCFGTDWKAWTMLILTLIFCALLIICIIFVIKYKRANANYIEVTDQLDTNKKIADDKSIQISKLTEKLSITEGNLKTATNTNAELEAQIMNLKKDYEKEIIQLKTEIEKLSAVDSVINEVKEVDAVVEEATKSSSEIGTEVKKKRKTISSNSKKSKIKKSEEEVKKEEK